MDIKAKVEELVKKIQGDPTLQQKFKKDPAGAIKELTGVDIPTDQLEGVIAAVKAKIGLKDLGDLGGKLGGLLGKK